MQSSSELRWDDVRIFLAAHRNKSFSAAAERLRVDVSTVSRRVAAFEASLDRQLFQRTRDGLIPTRAAERVLQAAEAMEIAHARLTREASPGSGEVEGVVRLSVAPGMADVFVAPSLVRLRARHPRIVIELDAATAPRDIARREADLALRSVKPRGAELVAARLGSAVWLPAASPSQVAAWGPVASWNDVPWIGWDRDMANLSPARWLARHAPRAGVVLRTSAFNAQLAAAEAGLGAVLMPLPYVRARALALVRHGRALKESVAACPSDDLWLVGHRVLRREPRIDAVWSFLSEELRRLAGTL